MSTDLPAILGGTPSFDRALPFVRPRLPRYADLENELREIISSGMLTKGARLRQFEEDLAQNLQAKYAVAVSSCTSGLMLTYQALGLTGEVIVPSFTFMATVSAMVWCDLTPVYVDVNVETTNIEPERVEAAITPRTSAIVAVHNFGNPAPIDKLLEIADKHGLKLIFDSAHGFGTLYRGKPVGSQGDAHSFSMSPTKLPVAGEGGVVATNDARLAESLRLGREYGNNGAYDSLFAGMNARMPEVNALLGIHGLKLLEETVGLRNQVAVAYRKGLEGIAGIDFQQIDPRDRSSYKDFSILIRADQFGLSRDELVEALKAERIDTRNYYDPPVHRQQAYSKFSHPDMELTNTNILSEGSVSLPIGAQVDEEAVGQICDAIKRISVNAVAVRQALREPVSAS